MYVCMHGGRAKVRAASYLLNNLLYIHTYMCILGTYIQVHIIYVAG